MSKNQEKKENSRIRALGTRDFHVSGFPIEFFNKWNASCIKEYGDSRWIKIWNDHCKAQEADKYQFLLDKIEELSLRVGELEKQPGKKENEQEGVKTLGGVIKG